MKTFDSTPKELPKYCSKEEIEVVIDKANHDTGKHGRRNHLILTVLWQTGMRAEEITNLRKKDIQTDTIIIRGGKGGKDRVIPVKNDLRTSVLLYSDQLNGDEQIFPLSTRQIRNIVYHYSEMHPHTFRHSFAVHCLKSGMNIRTLQKILGHSGLNTTQVYLDLSGVDVNEEYKKVNW